MIAPRGTSLAVIERFVRETGAGDAVAAIRQRAAHVIDAFVAVFGEPKAMPLDLVALASFLGIALQEGMPSFSSDAELVPDGSGGVAMRVNPDRPETRQRFSIGHEITHTFFPDHASHVWPRADARYRTLDNPDDYLEMLCDVGAAELVLPRRWFVKDAAAVQTGEDLLLLANKYGASRHATLRRFVELHSDPLVAVFFSWKLKPTQSRTVGRPDQRNLFGISPEDEVRGAIRLRVDYAIPSKSFTTAGHYLPRDKSVSGNGPLHQAAVSGRPCDGECDLDLGQAAGRYRVNAIPLWTGSDEIGPNGEHAVAAILRPLRVSKPKKKATPADGPSLF